MGIPGAPRGSWFPGPGPGPGNLTNLDIFSVATRLSEHPQTPEEFEQLVLLVADPQNHFTRWAAARAINQMGARYIERAKESLLNQAQIEDYELTANEIRDALGKLPPSAT